MIQDGGAHKSQPTTTTVALKKRAFFFSIYLKDLTPKELWTWEQIPQTLSEIYQESPTEAFDLVKERNYKCISLRQNNKLDILND
jgi:hypothetical protein